MAQVTSVMPVAKMVGSNRVVLGCGIVHVLGNPELPLEEEKTLRQQIVMQAFETLAKEADGS